MKKYKLGEYVFTCENDQYGYCHSQTIDRRKISLDEWMLKKLNAVLVDESECELKVNRCLKHMVDFGESCPQCKSNIGKAMDKFADKEECDCNPYKDEECDKCPEFGNLNSYPKKEECPNKVDPNNTGECSTCRAEKEFEEAECEPKKIEKLDIEYLPPTWERKVTVKINQIINLLNKEI